MLHATFRVRRHRAPLEPLLVIGLGLGGSALACAATRAAPPAPAAVRPAGEYRVGVEDVLEIVVWKEPHLSAVVPVRPDGRISVPLAGELRAAGRTARELQGEIAGRLASTIASPVVSVLVKELNSGRIYVLGEVARPGAYPLRGELSVLQALALAGGLTEFADGRRIVVLRRDTAGQRRRLGFDYRRAVGGGDPVALEPGDTVVVP